MRKNTVLQRKNRVFRPKRLGGFHVFFEKNAFFRYLTTFFQNFENLDIWRGYPPVPGEGSELQNLHNSGIPGGTPESASGGVPRGISGNRGIRGYPPRSHRDRKKSKKPDLIVCFWVFGISILDLPNRDYFFIYKRGSPPTNSTTDLGFLKSLYVGR